MTRPDRPEISWTRGAVPSATITAVLHGPWEVEWHLVVDPPGRLVLVGTTVRLRYGVRPPAGGLTGGTLDRLRVGDYMKHLDPLLQYFRRASTPSAVRAAAGLRRDGFRFLLDGPPATPPGPARIRRRGRPRLSDRDLARSAEAYIAAVRRGSRRPVLDAADELGEDAERVRDHLHRARGRGLLAASLKGAAGGTLTATARALLRRRD